MNKKSEFKSDFKFIVNDNILDPNHYEENIKLSYLARMLTLYNNVSHKTALFSQQLLLNA